MKEFSLELLLLKISHSMHDLLHKCLKLNQLCKELDGKFRKISHKKFAFSLGCLRNSSKRFSNNYSKATCTKI